MSVYTTKLKAKKSGTEKQINIYSTATEATPNYPVAGSYWECKVGGTKGYMALYPVNKISTSGHETSRDAYLTVKKDGTEYRLQTSADRRFYITITNVSGQTIVDGNGTAITSQYVAEGGSLTFNLSPATGHNKGTLKVDGTAVTLPYTLSNITAAHTITSVDGGLKDCQITITQPTGGTITVTTDGIGHTSSYSVKYGTTYKASIAVTATSGTHSCYKTGTLSPGTSGTITGATTFSHSPNPLTKNTITLAHAAVSYGTYTLTVNGTARAATSAATSLSVACGSSYAVTYNPPANTAQYSYSNPGNVSTTTIHSNTSLTKNIGRTTNQYTITKSACTGSTLSVKYTNSSGAEIASGAKVDYGTVIYVSFGNASHYTGTTCTHTNNKAYTVTGNVTVKTSGSVLDTHTFTISAGANQTITVTRTGGSASYDGKSSWTSTFTARHGMTWKATIAASSGYNAGTLSATSGTVSANTTVSATAATLKIAVGDLLASGSDYSSHTLTIPSGVNKIQIIGFAGCHHIQGYVYLVTGGKTYYSGSTISVTPGSQITYRCDWGADDDNFASEFEYYWNIYVAGLS